MFIAFIGLQNAGIAVDGEMLVELVSFRKEFSTTGICALLALIGTLGTAVMYVRKIPGSMLIGIVGTWVLGMLCQLAGIYVVDPESGHYSLFPSFEMTDFSAFGSTFGKCFESDILSHSIFDFIVVIFSFLFVDLFDVIGTLIGVSSKADMLDKDNKLPRIRPALLSNAIATTSGAIFGTSTTTTFVESAAGVGAGGRTGLTAFVTAVLFLFSTLLAPIFIAIPSFATAPALIMVGFLMFTNITNIKFSEENYTETLPAYICIISMPLFYSISEGISFGVISYVVINLLCGKTKKLKPIMCVLAVLFVLKYVFL